MVVVVVVVAVVVVVVVVVIVVVVVVVVVVVSFAPRHLLDSSKKCWRLSRADQARNPKKNGKNQKNRPPRENLWRRGPA